MLNANFTAFVLKEMLLREWRWTIVTAFPASGQIVKASRTVLSFSALKVQSFSPISFLSILIEPLEFQAAVIPSTAARQKSTTSCAQPFASLASIWLGSRSLRGSEGRWGSVGERVSSVDAAGRKRPSPRPLPS